MTRRCFSHSIRHCAWAGALAVFVGAVAAAPLPSALADDQPGKQPSKAPAVPQQVQLPRGVRMERDIAYISDGDEAQRLDLYLPETPAERPLPLIVHIHGGAWRGGSKFPCPVVHMAGKGYAVASVEYRFSQVAVFPAQIQDCQAAIRWLRARSQKYNFDPQHIGVVGGSAGGHLSALVGTAGGKKAYPLIGGNEDQSDRVQAVCDYFGPTNFATVVQQAADDKNVRNIFKFNSPSDPYSLLIGASLDADRQKTDAVSPVHYVSKDNPPMLILHGTHDALVPYAQSEELAAALKAAGVEVWLQKLPGSGHGGPAFSKPAVGALIQNFFDKHLRGVDVKIELVPEADLAVEPPQPAAKSQPAPPRPMPSFAEVPFGPHPHQLMDIYLPAKGDAPYPALLWFGGIWKAAKHPANLGFFGARGIAVIAVEVRTMEDATAAQEKEPIAYVQRDAIRAVQFVRHHAAQWKLDPRRLATGGGSQGAQPALFVGCSRDQANPASSDPVERESSLVTCVAAYRCQPTFDPVRMQDWVPGVKWGAPALGVSFDESLRRHDELLPVLRKWSPDYLLHQDAAPMFFENEWGLTKPDDVAQNNYDVHSPRWALGFQRLALAAGAQCHVKFPDHPADEAAKDIWEFVAKQLRR